MELAIDTSFGTAGIALAREGRVVAELVWHCPQNQTAELLPNLRCLLSRLNLSLADISCIVVAKGPGTFNGVRVGLATAKGLCLGLGVPLVGVSTLEAMSFPLRYTGLLLCPLLPAGRGEVAVALFRRQRGQWQKLVAEHITPLEGLSHLLRGKTLVLGEITPELSSSLRNILGRRAGVLPWPVSGRAGGVAALGWEQFQRQGPDNPATLQPLYLRPPAITPAKPKEVQHA